MSWALNANGFIGDAEKVAELFAKIKALLSDPETGVTNSQFTGPGLWENDFHKPADAAPLAASAASPAPTEADAGDGSAAQEPVSPAGDDQGSKDGGKKGAVLT